MKEVIDVLDTRTQDILFFRVPHSGYAGIQVDPFLSVYTVG
jgi:hypothetical protein